LGRRGMSWKPNWVLVDPVAKRRAYRRCRTQLKELMLTGDYKIILSKWPDTVDIATVWWRRGFVSKSCRLRLGEFGDLQLLLDSSEEVYDITPQDEEEIGTTIRDWLDKDSGSPSRSLLKSLNSLKKISYL
jgi:hypothetical protein